MRSWYEAFRYLLAGVLGCCCAVALSAADVELQIKTGWNLKALPVATVLTDDSPLQETSLSKLGDFTMMWVYRDKEWLKNPSTVYPSEGVWIRSSEDYAVSFSGESYAFEPQEDAGWQLLGVGETIERSDFILSASHVIVYSEDDGFTMMPETIQAGEGFWYKPGVYEGDATESDGDAPECVEGLAMVRLFDLNQSSWTNSDYNEAYSLLTTDDEDASCLAGLADMSYFGYGGVEQDSTTACNYAKQAADKGNPYGMVLLGYCYGGGLGNYLEDYETAYEWFLQAANEEDPDGQTSVGDMYFLGLVVDQNYTTALQWYQKAADQGSPYGQENVGDFYYAGLGGVEQDYATALQWYQKAADQGSAYGQDKVGDFYYAGLGGLEQDYVEAMVWYLKAAGQNHAYAQAAVGDLYYYGQGVDQDYTEALTWFLKAAEQGNAYGQYSAGYLYRYGEGVDQDYAEALTWFLKAAEQDYAYSQYELGVMYENGYGVDKDVATAKEWYQKAADQGVSAAQTALDNLNAEIYIPGVSG